jgi:hypothetical protein
MSPVDELRAVLQQLACDALQPLGDDGTSVAVVVPGGRRQAVRASRTGSTYVFASTAVARRYLQDLAPERVAALVWQRNQAGEVVAFGVDARGRLVGRAELPCGMLTTANARFLVERVASECDRLEYLLTGGDHE